MKEPHEVVNQISSKESFRHFVELLINDLEVNPQNWENQTLPDFLQAIHTWTEGMEVYYEYTGQPIPTNVNWKVFADILMAATMYE